MSRRPKISTIFLVLIFLFLLFASAGCVRSDRGVISLKKLSPNYPGSVNPEVASSRDRVLRVAAAPVISPRENLVSYGDLLDYLSQVTGYKVTLIQRPTYAEINNLMKAGEVDVAFVCTYSYVQGHEEFGMELLAAPQVHGKAEYQSYLIVPANSKVSSLSELRGKSFAFTDLLSTSGRLVPLYWLREMGTTPDNFFKSYQLTYSHDNAIRAVAEGLVDGAAVDSIVYDTMVAQDSTLKEKIKVILRSESFASPPVVIHPLLPQDLKDKLKKFFLTLDQTARGRQALAKLGVERFVSITDDKYNSVRAMAKRVGEK